MKGHRERKVADADINLSVEAIYDITTIKKANFGKREYDRESVKLGWKSILLLQFQTQFKFAITLGILMCYAIVMYEASQALAVMEYEEPIAAYMTETKAVVFSFDIFYAIDFVFMICFKNTELPGISHRYQSRNALLLFVEVLTLVPIDAIFFNVARLKKASSVAMLRLRYAVRMVRIIYDRRIPPAMTKEHDVKRVTLQFLVVITLIVTTMAVIMHPYMCKLSCKPNDINYFYQNLYVATEKITGKGFGNTHLHGQVLDEVTTYLLSIMSFLAYIGLGYSTSRLVCTFISNDLHIYSFLIKYSKIKEDLAAWKKKHQSTWKNYDESLYITIQTYYHMIWDKKRWYLNRVFKEEVLPKIIFKDIYLDMSWSALKHSHLFRRQAVHFLRELANRMNHTVYAPGEVLYGRYQEKSGMVYIVTGIVQILSGENGETPIISLSGGTCLGESSLVIDYPSSWSVVCKTYCEVTILEKKDFIKISLIYPKIFRKLTAKIIHRYTMAKRMKHVYQYQWDRDQVSNSDTLTMMWIKRSLHQLIDSHNPFFDKITVWDDSYGFCADYLDMFVIAEDIELVSDKIFLRKKFPCIFQPESIFLDGWNFFVALIATVVVFAFPCYMIYCKTMTFTTHMLVLVCITLVYCTDIYIQSSTAIRTKDVLLSNFSSVIYYRLTNSWFIMDIVSAFPFSVFLNTINNQIPYETLLLAEVNKLIKIYRVSFIFEKIENLRFANKVVLKYIKVFIMDFLLFYYTATVLYYLLCGMSGCPREYIKILKKLTDNVTKSKLLLHLYCSAALFLGNITHVDFMQFLTLSNTIWIILLQFLYTFIGIFTLSFVSILETLKESRVHEFKEFVSTMDVVMKDFSINPDLQRRIKFYLKDHFWMDKGLTILEPHLFSRNMSPNLYAITKQVIYGKFLHEVPLFRRFDETVVLQISRCLTLTHYPPGEVITYAGEVCNNMHIIEHGYCRILSEHKVLTIGDIFCMIETCLEVPTFFTVITLTSCRILSISYKDYAKLKAMFPSFKQTVERALESILPEDLHRIAAKYSSSEEFNFERGVHEPLVRKFRFKKMRHRYQESRYQYLSEFASFKGICRFFLLPWTFPTNGKFVWYWEICRILFAFSENFTISFMNLCSDCNLTYVVLCFDITAWLDIYWRQHVCYYNKLGIEVSHPMKTAIHYWKHGLLIDLIASLPIEHMFLERRNPYARINRMVQLHRLISFVHYIDRNNTSRSKLFRLGKYIPMSLLLLNYLASIVLYTTCNMDESGKNKRNCIADRWAKDHLKDSQASEPFKDHMASLMVISMGFMMIGFTKLHFVSMVEIFNSCWMNLTGHLLFVWLTARTVANNFYRKTDLTEYQEAMNNLLLFVNYKKIDKNIKKEIIDYFEYMWKKTKGKNLVDLLKPFSTAIKEDILYDMFGKSMNTSSIFSKAPQSFFKSLFLGGKYEVYIHKGIIYHVNDVHGFIFVLLKGHVEILGPDFNKLLILSVGSIFGNLDNCQLSRQTLTLVAKGHVEVMKIKTTYFHSVLSKYPRVLHRFIRLTAINVDYLENLEKIHSVMASALSSAILYLPKRKRSWYFSCYLHITKIFEENIATRVIKTTIMVVCCFCGFHLELYQLGSYEDDPFFVATLYALDAVYLVKIYLHFHIAYIDDSGLPVNNRVDIARNYIRQKLGFYFDLASSLPIEIIAFAFVTHPSFWIVWSWLRKNRLIRIVLVLYFLKSSQEKLHVNIKVVRIVYTITWITIVIQSMAVLMLFFRFLNYAGGRNAISEEAATNLLIETYTIIIYSVSGAALTNLNTPFTAYIVVNSVIIMLVCRLFLMLFISETCSMLENANQNKNKYRLFTLYLMYQVKEEDVSVPLRKRIGEYLNLLWTHNKGVQFPRLLKEAPCYLKEAILNAMYGFHLRKHPLLMHCHTDLIRQMAATFDVIIFFPGNFVTYVGDVDGCMYFIHKGEVNALIEDTMYEETFVDVLETGDYFGLDQGLYKNCLHNYTYKVTKYSVILALQRTKWIHLLDFFPASRRVLFELRDMYIYQENQ